jgi:hypothetical protein
MVFLLSLGWWLVVRGIPQDMADDPNAVQGFLYEMKAEKSMPKTNTDVAPLAAASSLILS